MLNNEDDEIIKNAIKKIETKRYNSYEIENIISIANKRKKRKNILSVITVLVTILLVSFVIIFHGKLNSFTNNVKINANNLDESLYNDTIIIDNEEGNIYVSDSFPDIVAIVKIDEILKNEFSKESPKTLVRAEILEVKNGTYDEDIIEFYIEQCIVEEISEEMKSKYNILNNKKVRIVKNESLSKLEYPVAASIYIVALKNVNNDLYVDTEYKYSFNKFDIQNNLIYINNTWSEIN